jgi:hypothetical protein
LDGRADVGEWPVACDPLRVRRPSPRIAVELPKEWEDRSILTFVGPEDHGFRPTLILARKPLRGVSFDQRVEEESAALSKQLLRFQKHGTRTSEIGGRKASWVEFSFHSKEAGNLRQILAFIDAGSEMITASLTAGAQQFEPRRAEYTTILEGIDLETLSSSGAG